jgi:Fic family protein
MVNIKKKKIGNQEYYYLEHSFRVDGKTKKIEKYLGKEIPKDIEKLKQDILFGLYKEKWFKLIENIKENYQKEEEKLPISAKEKEIEIFTTKFTYNSQRIEGSKLTFRDTANLLERGITPTEKPVRDIKEAELHKKVFYSMLDYKKDLSLQIVLYWHKTLFESTKQDIAGKIRSHQVAISGSKFMPPIPAEIQALLNEFFDWYNQNKGKINAAELAALVHLKFVTIHPFSDGNGRISRLMMNFVLHKKGLPMLDIPYEKRNSYYTALERSQVKNNDYIFLHWFFKKYLKEYRKLIKF